MPKSCEFLKKGKKNGKQIDWKTKRMENELTGKKYLKISFLILTPTHSYCSLRIKRCLDENACTGFKKLYLIYRNK